MGENKRYYWIKLPVNYFDELPQRKMRKQGNGLLYQVIYLKMLLYSSTKGKCAISYMGVYDTIAEEIADAIQEEVQDVEQTLSYLKSNNLIECCENDILLPQAETMIGSETQGAERMRKYRKNKRTLQSDTDVTKHEVLHCDTDVTMCDTEGEKKRGRTDIEGKGEEPEPDTDIILFGQHKRVEMTATEHEELVSKYGERITNDYIAKADNAGEKRQRKIDHGYNYISRMIQEDNAGEKTEDVNKSALKTIESLYLDQVKGG